MSQDITKFLDVILNWRHVSAPTLGHLQVTKICIVILLGLWHPDLNLVMNSIRILNKNEISLSFRLIYFVSYTV